jgi:hypothetical protein
MVKIKILRTTNASGVQVHAGEVVEVSQKDATALIQMDKALPHGGDAPEAESRETEVVEGLTTKSAEAVVDTAKKPVAKKKTTKK